MTLNLIAPCRDVDPEVFFPVNENDQESTQVLAAKEICGRCLIEEACLRNASKPFYDQFGDLFHDVHGVRGGLTGPERELRLRRTRRNPAAQPATAPGPDSAIRSA